MVAAAASAAAVATAAAMVAVADGDGDGDGGTMQTDGWDTNPHGLLWKPECDLNGNETKKVPD